LLIIWSFITTSHPDFENSLATSPKLLRILNKSRKESQSKLNTVLSYICDYFRYSPSQCLFYRCKNSCSCLVVLTSFKIMFCLLFFFFFFYQQMLIFLILMHWTIICIFFSQAFLNWLQSIPHCPISFNKTQIWLCNSCAQKNSVVHDQVHSS
jgi:hypothetical protein